MDEQSPNQLIDHLFRHEAGRLVSTLTRLFGTSNIELAEDIVQDTLVTALDHWTLGAIPDNPAAWLTQVAKRKALNEINRRNIAQKHHAAIKTTQRTQQDFVHDAFLPEEIHDNMLRMIFTCCHPSLSQESQIALTLKVLCGFGIKEIARALMMQQGTINKRLYRAKNKIRNNTIDFEIPYGHKLNPRLDNVCLTLYLLFNEGYNSAHPESIIRWNLCSEAIRLIKMLIDKFKASSHLHALLALMYFHTARFEARLDKGGGIIIFKDQDRQRWDKELISLALQHLKRSSQGKELTHYHLEAGIAAEHCIAESYEKTNWASILNQYNMLYTMKPSPVIKLNMAIVQSQVSGLQSAVEQLEKLLNDTTLQNYYLLHATLGTFYLRQNRYNKASEHLAIAKQLTTSQHEIQFLEEQLKHCR